MAICAMMSRNIKTLQRILGKRISPYAFYGVPPGLDMNTFRLILIPFYYYNRALKHADSLEGVPL